MSDDAPLLMSSSRPYFLRAMWEWLVDNQLTPHILVDATIPDTFVPSQFVQDGQIVLNISPTATVALNIANDLLSFNAKFSGSPMDVSVPVEAVMGIYARENGQGMFFEVEDDDPEPDGPTPVNLDDEHTQGGKPPPKGKPSLQIVK